jgi:hypothetical protein
VGVDDADVVRGEWRTSSWSDPPVQHPLRHLCHERGYLLIDLTAHTCLARQLHGHKRGATSQEVESPVYAISVWSGLGEVQPALPG